jgi:FtsP/CotA-like multicopper oxidase with cupredoxin domain
MGMTGTDHEKIGAPASAIPEKTHGEMGHEPRKGAMHGPDTHGPGNAMVAMNPRSRLHEPGIGLENTDRRVLVYSDLRALEPGGDRREPEREIELHLTGNMERFVWGFNGKRYSESDPIAIRHGERLRVILVNDTMMEHPLHLHGMFMELENGHGDYNPRKFTINVKPGERLSFLMTADAPGAWPFHCHLDYHMAAGMMIHAVVSGEGVKGHR